MWWPIPQSLQNNLPSVSMIDNGCSINFFNGTKLYKSFGSFMNISFKIKIKTALISFFSQECQE